MNNAVNGTSMNKPPIPLSVMKKDGRTYNRPKDQKAFVGCLVGGYKDTRADIAKELAKRYGISVVKHFGLEKQNDPNLYVETNIEICVILADDIKNMLPRVLAACKKSGVPHIGISRKAWHTWDASFLAEGFTNPPKWLNDGFFPPAPAQVSEEQRLAELRAAPETRLAWEDPALVAARLAKASEPAVDLSTLFPAAAPAPAPAKEPVKEKPLTPAAAAKAAEEAFHNAVRAALERSGLPTKKFAEKIDMSVGGVDNWRNGKGGLPQWTSYAALNKSWPDLFPPIKGLRGELKAMKQGLRLITAKEANTVKVPPPAPYVPPAVAAKAPAPVVAAPVPPAPVAVAVPAAVAAPAPAPAPVTPSHVTSYVLTGSVDELVEAANELKASDVAVQEALKRREAALGRLDAIHRLMTGR